MICPRASSLWRSEQKSSSSENVSMFRGFIWVRFSPRRHRRCGFSRSERASRKKSQFHFMRAFSGLMTRRGRRVHKWKEDSEASCATCERDENEKSIQPDTRLVLRRPAMVWGFSESVAFRHGSQTWAESSNKLLLAQWYSIAFAVRCDNVRNKNPLDLDAEAFLLGWQPSLLRRLNDLRINSLEKREHTKAAGSRIHQFGELGN